jgi:hypothetical protein
MSDIPIWRCEIVPLAGDPGAAPLNNLTVGSKFELDCNGDISVVWQGPAQVAPAKEENKYELVILKVISQEPTSARYVVTSYKAGNNKPEFVRILSGDQGFEATGLTWNVQSVLPKDRKPEVNPSIGPYLLNLPVWVWGIVIGVALLISLIAWRITRRYRQRKKVLLMLKEHDSALPPHGQFHKDLRQIKKAMDRQEPALEKLDNDFRLYLLRAFQVPALDWSDGEILRDVRKKHKTVYEREAKRMAKVLRELGQLKKSSSIKPKDMEQMFVLCRDTVDRIEKVRSSKVEGRR